MLHKENSVNYSLSFIPLKPLCVYQHRLSSFYQFLTGNIAYLHELKNIQLPGFSLWPLQRVNLQWLTRKLLFLKKKKMREREKTCFSSHQAVSSLAQGGTASRPNTERRENMTDWLMLDSSMCGQHDIRPPSKNAPKKTHQCPIYTSSQSECRADLTMTKLRVCQ